MPTVTVLFATDKPADALIAGLAELGIVVTTHAHLLGLYPAMLKAEPDVILLDGELPRLALEATARFLRSKNVRLPIVLYASSRDETVDPYALAAACESSDMVDKDAPLSALARAIVKVAPAVDPFAAIPGSEPNATVDGPPVLVVDDDRAIGKLLGKILSQKYAVTIVEDGATALARMAETSFAAIFCDLRMPGMTGADIYRSVRATNPGLAERIVFVTAHELDALEATLFMELRNHLVKKPFSMREVLRVAAQVTQS